MKEAQDDPESLRKHMLHTYVSSRIGVAAIGGLLPIALSVPVWLRREMLLESISEYYYSFMGDVFVGALIAVGISLFLYKGFGSRENYALNAAGIFAVMVALFPMRLASELGGQLRSRVHYTSAILLFLCLGYVCIYRAGDTLSPSLVPDRKRAARLYYTYRVLGILMFTLPVSAIFFGRWWKYFAETVSVLTFAMYWAIKTVELRRSGADVLAAEGRLSAREAVGPGAERHVAPSGEHDGIGRLHVV
ncbi:MAG TPA: hypothetical protein VNM92_05215 [Thermoanaerobaculia bacterium]|nr:hypothetical protein [Thermoanaerobaculia bacterium]